MKNFKNPTVSIIIFLLFSVEVSLAQATLDSNSKGVKIIRSSLMTHGGESAVEKIKISFKAINNKFVNEAQSWLSEPPFDYASIEREFKIDYSGNKQVFLSRTINRAAGDFVFGGTVVLIDNKGFTYDPIMKEYDEVTINPIQNGMFLPQAILFESLKNPYAVRLLKEDDEAYTLSVIGVNNSVLELKINKHTNRLIMTETLRSMNVYGDAAYRTVYENYQLIDNKVLMPQKVSTVLSHTVFDRIENTFTLQDFSTDFDISETELAVPEEYKKGDYSYRKPFELHTLATNIYMIENVTSITGRWSYNILFAVFDDFVLVTEAVSNSAVSQKIITKIKEVAPNKPIKYLVQTHHHGDHLGGIREYIVEGTTIITTPANENLIKRIGKAPYTINPDRQAQNPKEPRFEIIQENKKSIKQNKLEAIICNVGSLHAKDMLVVYFPKEKIIYQSDLINNGEYPSNKSSLDFLAKLKELKWDVEIIVGSHGKTTLRK